MSFGGIFDLETLQSQQDELEKMMSAPGFWDYNEKAAKISEEHASAAKKINLFGSLESRVSDIDELIAFAAEEGDQGSVSEVKKEIDELSLMLGDLEMELLLSFFFQAEDGIRDAQESRGLGDVYKRQPITINYKHVTIVLSP